MMWMICLFGGLGAMARYVLDVSIQRGWNRENRRTNRNFPLSTLVINGVASLCAGIAMMSYYSQSVDMDTVMMFVVGFLGGFSTFSTALNEVVSLIRQRRFTLALGYGIATVTVPLICVATGFGIALLAVAYATGGSFERLIQTTDIADMTKFVSRDQLLVYVTAVFRFFGAA